MSGEFVRASDLYDAHSGSRRFEFYAAYPSVGASGGDQA